MTNYLKKLHNIIAFIFYLLISLILTYPLINNIFTSISGIEGDSFLFLWNHWWVKYSLLNFHNPYFTDIIAYPFNTTLIFHTLTFINSLVSAIFQSVIPLVLAFNLIFIFSLSAAAFGAYLLIYYLLKNRFTALIGGLFFAFNSYIWSEAQGHFQCTSIFFIPFVILYFIKIVKEDKMKNFLIFGILLSASFYNEFYYSVGLLVFVAMSIIWLFITDRQLLISKIKNISLGLVTWLVLSAPLLYLSIKTALSKTFPFPNLGQINLYSPDIRSFVTPPPFQTIYGGNFANFYHSLNFHGSIIYLSFILILLSLFGYFLGKNGKDFYSSKFWIFLSVVFILMVLGPFLYLDGYIFKLDGVMFTIPLPYILFYFLPFMKGIMAPPRFIIFVILFLTVISGFFLNKIFEKLNGKILLKGAVAILIMGVFTFENFSAPIPIVNAEIPKLYYELREEDGDYTILELPFALSTTFYTLGGVNTSAKLQYYQAAHRKKILGGYISRIPDDYYEFYSRTTGLDYLIDPNKKLEESLINKVKSETVSNFSKLKVKYIIVHPEYYNHGQLKNSLDFLNLVFSQKPKFIDNMLVYQIWPSPDDTKY